jgi:DNA-binding NarL/FixJ family response regulator
LSDPDVVSEALRLGASYVHKPSVQGDLLPAIEATLSGEQFVSRDIGFG